ncbi:hypothetical protein, partial [Sphingomonas bacterium]|uniref:hypothetical protein n=1 Tax=Sphingomonas bacterium TaxID=1895847 RepID=UPI001C2D9340
PPPAFAAAAQAFGTCLGAKTSTAPTAATTDDAAKAAIAGCAAEQAALSTQFESWVSSPSFPAAYRDAARAQFSQRMAAVPAEISQAIAERRAGAATPAPAPSPTPGR